MNAYFISGFQCNVNVNLVEAHDVLVERVPDDVRGEVGVRRELLLEQLVVLAKDHLKSTVILLSHPYNKSYVKCYISTNNR